MIFYFLIRKNCVVLLVFVLTRFHVSLLVKTSIITKKRSRDLIAKSSSSVRVVQSKSCSKCMRYSRCEFFYTKYMSYLTFLHSVPRRAAIPISTFTCAKHPPQYAPSHGREFVSSLLRQVEE